MIGRRTLEKRLAAIEEQLGCSHERYLKISPLALMLAIDRRNAEPFKDRPDYIPLVNLEVSEEELRASAQWTADNVPWAKCPWDVWFFIIQKEDQKHG